MPRLFVYGTLLDPGLVARLTRRPARPRPAVLDGFQRVRLRGTPYPTLRRGQGSVAGALLLADREAFRRLAAYEGPRYRLTSVRARLAGGTELVAARAWIAAGATRLPWP
jgi:gamma-glutamylcyclotransferase (GGCT)/AIG2-like uncharacterized protein YtfP